MNHSHSHWQWNNIIVKFIGWINAWNNPKKQFFGGPLSRDPWNPDFSAKIGFWWSPTKAIWIAFSFRCEIRIPGVPYFHYGAEKLVVNL